jgi:hypothetical protein
LQAAPDTQLLLDTRALTDEQVSNITNTLIQQGINPARIIAPSPQSYGPIRVVNPNGTVVTH